mgnify:CR=1 FL=1
MEIVKHVGMLAIVLMEALVVVDSVNVNVVNMNLMRQTMPKKGLYANINKRKKAGTSRSKAKSTITAKAYANMKAGFPKKKK